MLHTMLRRLVNAWPDCLKEKDSNGMTPLHIATLHHNDDAIFYIYNIYKEAINKIDNKGNYPFHLACSHIKHLNTRTLHGLLDSYPNIIQAKNLSCFLIPLMNYLESNPSGNDELFLVT